MDPFIPISEVDIDKSLIGFSEPTPITNSNHNRVYQQPQWKSGPITIDSPEFIGQPGLKIEISSSQEFDFFFITCVPKVNFILCSGNQQVCKKRLEPSDFVKYKIVTEKEIYQFICLLMYMGICPLPTYEMYWKEKGNLFQQSFISDQMPFKRFSEIKKYFHVFDSDVYDTDESSSLKKYKMDRVIEYFNNKFFQAYKPERDLALDENLCAWSGRGGSKVYLPLKPIKYGLKFYAICESTTGYACSLSTYNKKNSEKNVDMIKKLVQKYQGYNHHLYMDNFYTSLNVFDMLFELGIYACGTLRDGRGGPTGIKHQLINFNKGEGVILNNGHLNCIGMKDNGCVLLLSNIHSAKNERQLDGIILNSGNKLILNMKENEIVKDYNKYMGGVDLMDQMIGYYSAERKSNKWTSKTVFHLLSIATHSFILFKKKQI